MFIKILAWLWIIAGIIFLIKPQILRKKLQKKSIRKIRSILFLLAIFLGSSLISVGIKFDGGLAKLILLAGIISIIKGFFLIKAKTYGKLIEWSAASPVIYFRIGGLCYVAVGVILLILSA